MLQNYTIFLTISLAASVSLFLLTFLDRLSFSSRWKETLGLAIAFLGLVLMIAALFSPALIISGRIWGSSDTLEIGYPSYVSDFELWTRGLYGGISVAADPHSQTFYLVKFLAKQVDLSWLEYKIFEKSLGALGAYLFFRNYSNSMKVGFVVSSLYLLNPFFAIHEVHYNIVTAFCIAPWLFLGLQWIKQIKHRHLGLIVFAVSLGQLLNGAHPQFALLVLCLALLWFFCSIFYLKSVAKTNQFGLVVLGIFLGLLICSPQLWTTMDYLAAEGAAKQSLERFLKFPLRNEDFLTLLYPHILGGTGWFRSAQENTFMISHINEINLYFGLIPFLVLVAYAAFIFLIRPKPLYREALFWGICLVASLIISSGGWFAVFVYHHVPVIDNFRIITRFLFIFHFSALMLLCVALTSKKFIEWLLGSINQTIILVIPLILLAMLPIIFWISKISETSTLFTFSIAQMPNLAISAATLVIAALVVNENKRSFQRRDDNSAGLRRNVSAMVLLPLFFGLVACDLIVGALRPLTDFDKAIALDLRKDYSVVINEEYFQSYPDAQENWRTANSVGNGGRFIYPHMSRLFDLNFTNGSGPLAPANYADLLRIGAPGDIDLSVVTANENSVLDLTSTRYLLVRKGAEPDLPKKITTRLGDGCGKPAITENFTAGFNEQLISGLRIVGYLECATELNQNADVAKIELLSARNGITWTQTLTAGTDLAESKYDFSENVGSIKHKKAKIYSTFEDVRGNYYDYVFETSFENEINADSIKLTGLAPRGHVEIVSLVLLDSQGKELVVGKNLSNDPERWQFAKSLPPVRMSGQTELYVNKRALPYVRLVGNVTPVQSLEQIRDALWYGRFSTLGGFVQQYSPSKDALIYEADLPPQISVTDCQTNDKVNAPITFSRVPSSIPFFPDSEIITTHLKHPCLLIISSRVSHLWQAYVNSKAKKTLRVNEISSGIFLPAGPATVLIKYENFLQLVFILCSFLIQMLLLILLPVAIRRSANKAPFF